MGGWLTGRWVCYVQVHAYDTTAHSLSLRNLGAELRVHAHIASAIQWRLKIGRLFPGNANLTSSALRTSDLNVRGGVVAHRLVRHLGQRAPDLPRLRLKRAVFDTGLQHDVLRQVALALAAGDELAAAGVVVAREALHAREAHDGLLDEPQALGRAGPGQVGDAEVGDAGVQQPVVVAHELPLGADAGRPRVDGGREGLEELGRADLPQRLLVARRDGLGHLRVQHLGRGDRAPLPRAEPRPREPPGLHRDEVHADERPEGLEPVLDEQPDQPAELGRRARESPYGRGDDGYCSRRAADERSAIWVQYFSGEKKRCSAFELEK